MRYLRLAALSFLCSFAVAFTIPVKSFAQETVPTTKTYIKLGEDFLHALYPALNDKKYTITVETSFRYDDPTDIPRAFTLDVGTGPKSLVIACCFNGVVGSSQPMKLPDPLEWGPPSPPPCPPAPACPLYATPSYPMRMKNVDKEGQLRPEQFLTGHFSFDVSGRLVAYTAQGSETSNHDADNQIYAALRSRSGLTESEITKIIRDSGAKYGFKDQEKFRDGLPLKEIERFIGKIELLSLEFEPLNLSWNKDPVNELGVWTYAVALMRAAQKDGNKLTYRAFFDHSTGALTSLHEWPDNPNRRY